MLCHFSAMSMAVDGKSINSYAMYSRIFTVFIRIVYFRTGFFTFSALFFHFDWFKCTTQNIYISLPSLSRVKKNWCLCFDCLLLFTIHISKFRLFEHSSNFLFNSQIPCYIPHKYKSIPILFYLILLNSIQTSKTVKNDITAECRRWINQWKKEQIK